MSLSTLSVNPLNMKNAMNKCVKKGNMLSMSNRKIINFASPLFAMSLLAGCATTSLVDTKSPIGQSYLKKDHAEQTVDDNSSINDLEQNDSIELNINKIKPLLRNDFAIKNKALGKEFSKDNSLSVIVNNMSVKSFLNYVFADLLSADYILGNNVTAPPITLNISNKISSAKLFQLSAKVLQERGLGIKHEDGVYFIHQLPTTGKAGVVMGFGREESTIPENPGQILQVVPLKYGIRISVERTLRGLIDAQITADFEQSALFIQGRRDQIVRAMDLIKILDVPSNRGKYIALISPVYISTTTFVESVTKLLQTEGVDVGRSPQKNENLVFIPLTQLGSVAVFTSEQEILNRVEYWAKQIDRPSKGTQRQYHVYTPRFARATDLGDSLAPLIGPGFDMNANAQDTTAKAKQNSAVIANNKKVNASVSNDDMTMVVDKRSNTLIFHASGTEYQSLLPLIKRMDTLPKQVLLSVTIAEVTLKDIFKRGFEFAVSSGKFSASAKGAFGLSEITGVSLDWASGANEIMSRFIEENSYVNVLSKPSILVRDGTEATINVGDKIPVSSGTTTGSSGDVISDNVSYTETGIKLTVTPTVNAQGVVIMKIVQDISNQIDGTTGVGGNPSFFERNLSTEVVADSGQTILLGGLISENVNNSDKGVPFLKSIPLLGALFESESKNNTKTELVIMVTPKVIERSNQWQGILNRFQNVLENIELSK